MELPPKATAEHFWKAFDTYLFDADGVLWRETEALGGAIQLVKQLITAGKRVLVVTNNSTRDGQEHAERFAKMGFSGITADCIVSSGLVLVDYIKKLKTDPSHDSTAHLPVYLLGSAALQQLLERNGIESFGPGPDPVPPEQQGFENLRGDVTAKPVFAVVGAFDAHFSYPKVAKAVNYLLMNDKKAPFLVTNEDSLFPGPDPGTMIPGAGLVSSALRHVSGREPVVMGKPSETCWKYICDKGQVQPKRTIMIGDRCDTDILFGHNNGLTTLLVLTGVTTMADVQAYAAQSRAALIPDYYADDLTQLLLPDDAANKNGA